jgi:hypothetical protein
MALFIGAVSHQGPFGPDYAERPAPDPAMFGLPTEDDGTRTDALLGQNIISCTHYEPDFDALRAASTRIILAAGVESKGQLANRGGFAVAGGWALSPSSSRAITAASQAASGRSGDPRLRSEAARSSPGPDRAIPMIPRPPADPTCPPPAPGRSDLPPAHPRSPVAATLVP